MSCRVEYLGIVCGRPMVRVDDWFETDLWAEGMDLLSDEQVIFGVEIDPNEARLRYLTIKDLVHKVTWLFRINVQSGAIEFLCAK